VALQCLVEVLAVPIESCARAETCKEIVETCAACDTDDKEAEDSGKEEEALAVDPFSVYDISTERSLGS
jgi:hypothetical protein